MKNLLVIFLLIPTFVFSQGWEKTYGHYFGTSVQQTIDGGYIVTGVTETFSSSGDVFLIKTNGNGDTLWTKTYGGNDDDIGYSVQQTTDSGYIITGRTHSYGNGQTDLYIIKTDSIGDTLWTKTYGGNNGDQGNSVQQTFDGGYIITGNTIDDSTFYLGVYLIKTDSIGDTLWTKTFGDSEGNSVQQTTDGGYIITGVKGVNTGNRDVYLIKTNGNGDTLWTKTYGGNYHDIGNSVQQTTDGGYIITGLTKIYSSSDVFLIKTNGNGQTLWTKTYGGNYGDQGNSVQQTNDGGYIITGHKGINTGNRDVYLIKTNGNGDTLWTKTYGGQNICYGTSVQQTTDGGYIITGDSTNYIYLIKTDSLGNTSSTSYIEIPTQQTKNRKLIKHIDFLGREIIYPKKNIPYIEIYDDGSVKKKVILE